jgi:putative Mn2+ efflux pump MntP
MNVFLVLGIALGLAMDTFAVAIGLSLGHGGLDRRAAFRMSFHFGLFQFGMTVIGWAAGKSVIVLVGSFDHWVAAGLLAVVGGKMIVESFHKEERFERKAADATRGIPLLVLSLATSLDALAVGLSYGALSVSGLVPAAVIGGVTFLVSFSGTKIGPALGKLAGRWAEVAGGVVLIVIGLKILAEHLGR